MIMGTRLAAVAGVSLMVALAGCSGGDSTSSQGGSKSGSGGPPACSDYAHGKVITEELSHGGCTGAGVTVNSGTSCDGHEAVAVGPVYGFVGKPAHYLGDGKDATKSPEWAKFQQDCPWASE